MSSHSSGSQAQVEMESFAVEFKKQSPVKKLSHSMCDPCMESVQDEILQNCSPNKKSNGSVEEKKQGELQASQRDAAGPCELCLIKEQNSQDAKDMADRLLKLTKRASSDKIITAKNINIYEPDHFYYYHQLGKGAYGMVRKCSKKQAAETVPENPSDVSSDALT